MEHADDPGLYPFPSIWSTDEMLNFIARRSLWLRTLHQCMLGGPCKKPTRLVGNLPGLEGEGSFCDGGHVHEKSVGRTKSGGFLSQRLSLYPSGMCEMLARWFVQGFQIMLQVGGGPSGWRRTGEAISRVSNWSTKPTAVVPVGVAILNEQEVRGFKTVVEAHQWAFYLHVDDGAFISCSDSTSDALMNYTADALENIGFQVKDRTPAGDCLKIIGFEVERKPARLRLPARKAWLLRAAMKHLSRQLVVDTGIVRAILGIWVWAVMLRRELLSAAFHISLCSTL